MKMVKARVKQNLMAQAFIDQSDLDWYRQQAPLDVESLISAIDMMVSERTTNNGYPH